MPVLFSSVLRLSRIDFISTSLNFHPQEEETRALVKSNGGLEPLAALIKNPENHGNKELMAAVSTAAAAQSLAMRAKG